MTGRISLDARSRCSFWLVGPGGFLPAPASNPHHGSLAVPLADAAVVFVDDVVGTRPC